MIRSGGARSSHAVPWLALAAALLATACGPGAEAPDATELPYARLEAALAAGRWIEPRLVGGSVYQSCRRTPCPDEQVLCEPQCAARSGDAGTNLFAEPVSPGAEADRPSPEERRAAAVWTLIASQEAESAAEAVEMLERSIESQPHDAHLHSDLAAARIALAQRNDQPQVLLGALATSQRAVELDPGLSEARFNRALASTLLSLGPDAAEAWRRFLATEPDDSPWAGEARERLDEITAGDDPAEAWRRTRTALTEAADRGDGAALDDLIDPFRGPVRQWVESEVLGDWARAHTQGRTAEAEQHLTRARRIAGRLAELQGDRLLAGAVAAIDRAAAEPDGRRLARLAEGHRLYAEAAARTLRLPPAEVIDRQRRAAAAFEAGGSPFAAWAEVGRAVALYQAHRLPEALDLLARRRADAEGAGHSTLLARILWLQALCELFSNLPPQARASYQEALDLYRAAGEHDHAASVHVRLAEVYRELGRDDLAWRHRRQALALLPRVPQSRARTYILGGTAAELRELGLAGAAHALQERALAIAREAGGDPVELAVALRDYAEISRDLQDPEQAQAALAEASRLSHEVPEPMGSAIRARIREVEGAIARPESPMRAVVAFGAALDLLPPDEYRGYRARLHLDRAAAYRDLASAEPGEPAWERKATADVAAALAEIDAEWQQVLSRRRRGEDEELWSSYFGRPQETFDRMIALLTAEGRPEEAFDYAERARARDLLALTSGGATAPRPRTAGEVVRGLPPETVLVAYALLDDRLVAWAFRRGGMSFEVVNVARGEIAGHADAIQRAARAGDPELAPAARRQLREILVPPALGIEPGERLVLVPDGPLHGLPFAALRDPASGRFLVEDHPIAIAPSATLYLHAVERDRTIPRAPSAAALFVGDPAFDPDRFLGLAPLLHAGTEVRRAAEEYPGARVLTGAEATRERFLELAGGHDVVHFAGHAVLDAAAPYRSMLVLAPAEPDGAGEVYADELLRRELPRTRLVVLSACSTAGGQPVGALGVAPLVRPFLGAGVPAVLGSLWDVDDAAAEALLTEFHRVFGTGADAATALQRAQVSLLESDNLLSSLPASWAAVQLVGTASLR